MTRDTPASSFALGTTTALADQMLDTLRLHPEVSRAAVAGSFRRAMEIVHDLDFLVATKSPALVCQDFTTLPQVASIINLSDTTATVSLHNGLQCKLHTSSNIQFPFALQHLTGSAEHNHALRALALTQGLELSANGLTHSAATAAAAPIEVLDEPDIYQAIGLDFIEPELRENLGEIAAAANHSLPRLVELANLRGTFHNHTTASDGIDSLDAMVAEAIDMGLQYLGIADHSKSTVIANGLDETRLLEQIATIRSLNAQSRDFRIFAGSEVDILRDGKLDFEDEMLAKLDYCVASVHNFFDLTEQAMTRRICRAMENEHVTMLGHLTGRMFLKRDAYPVNHSMIIDCAAATRTIIELNCSPLRLDMDWRWWRRARDKGVLCSINPDAHSTARLHHIGLGVRLARKGWLRRQDILNTRPLPEVEAFLNTPKSAR
jgi:DNA polymerase (family 10)